MSAALRLATALSLMASLAACGDALQVNLANIEDFGKPYEPPVTTEEDTPDPEPIPPQAAIPEPVGPKYGGPCNPATDSVFRIATCSDDGILYQLDSNMNWIIP